MNTTIFIMQRKMVIILRPFHFGIQFSKQNYKFVKGVIVGKAIYDKNLEVEDALKLLS